MVQAAVLLLAASLAFVAAGDYDPIILPGQPSDEAKLALFVPGGKVPIADYAPFLSTVLGYSKTNMFGVIVHCGKLNLCDPLGQLPGLVKSAIAAAGVANGNRTFAPKDIFVMGHSLGGVGARHCVDTFDPKGPSVFAGLALFGTQYNGDHEDFKGTLGYPVDLRAFPIPMLAVTGELDMVPAASHLGLLYQQYTHLSASERLAKPIVIIPGMDHSQFCSPFNVSGDIVPEIPNDLATHYAAKVTAAWVDAQVGVSGSAVEERSLADELAQWVDNATRPITGAWVAAHAAESTAWCENAQRIVIGDLPAAAVSKVTVSASAVNGSAALEHHHTKYSVDNATGELAVQIVSYPFYAQNASWNPIEIFGPTYASARDISCKLLSADRAAEQLKLAGLFPQKSPPVSCAKVNEAAVAHALELLHQHWPSAVERFARRGRNFTFAPDSSTVAGPQWVFLSSLGFEEGKAADSAVSVQSPLLYSSITSKIYPGNFYCKVLSPAKALEWIQTVGLTGRF